MPTREIADCIERLRGLQQCLVAVIDSPTCADIGAVAFLSTEIERGIEDLDRYLPTAQMIREDAINDLTCFPENLREAQRAAQKPAPARDPQAVRQAADELTEAAKELRAKAEDNDN